MVPYLSQANKPPNDKPCNLGIVVVLYHWNNYGTPMHLIPNPYDNNLFNEIMKMI